MYGIIKKMFVVLLANTVSASNHTKCVFLGNQKCEIQPTFINLHLNEYSQEFHFYPFTVKSGKCVGSCNTLNNLSNKVCVPNKTEDFDPNMCNMITGINESKKINKPYIMSMMEENVIQINGGEMMNVFVSVKNMIYVKNIMFGIKLYVIVKMANF